MYDFPEIRSATDALWAIVAHHLSNEGIEDVPSSLVHDVNLHQLWSDDNLFFSQTCGYDVVNRYQDRFQVIATPCYDVPGCNGADYASTIVVPEDSPYDDVVDMLGTVAVVNGPESQSGTNALFGLVAPYRYGKRFFSEVRISGSHMASLAVLNMGGADVASIDCMTYELLKRYRPEVIEGTRCLGTTYPAPAPPYVTRSDIDPDSVARMKNALLATFADSTAQPVLESLLLKNVVIGMADDYQRISTEFPHNLTAV